MSESIPVLVSACLLGRACRYDGASRPSDAVEDWLIARGAVAVAVCPEELGQLGTPRPAAELRGGDGEAVLSGSARVCRVEDGTDVSEAFVRGARAALQRGEGAHLAVLKARSPSCGCGRSWIDGQVRDGDGVFAALLRRRGVQLLTEEDLDG